MSDLTAVRQRWGFLQKLQLPFILAENFPSVERADQSHYDSSADEHGHNLMNGITLLRTDFRLNIKGQQELDITKFDKYPYIANLASNLEKLLQELEHLVDPQVASQLGDLEKLEVCSKVLQALELLSY